MTTGNNDWRTQLAPGWSGINIAILVVLFIVFAPLGLLMLGYILAGQALGLDLGRPETFTALFERLSAAVRAGIDRFNGVERVRTDQAAQTTEQAGSASGPHAAPDTAPNADGRPEPRGSTDFERDRLRAQREALDAERAEFEAEKKAFRDNQRDGA